MGATREVTISKLNDRNEVTISYPGELMYADETAVVVRCLWSLPRSIDLGPFAIQPGDIFVEFYYPGEWFDIFAIYDATGVVKGWYCNITYEAEIADGQIRWRDLALDYLALPDGRRIVLDRDEFKALSLSPEIRARAERALETLAGWAAEGRYPFPKLAPQAYNPPL